MVVVREDSKSDRYLHPEGQFAARCIDIIDLGEVETRYKNRTKVQWKVVIRFYCGQKNGEGEDLYVGHRLTATLSERSNMRKFLTAWRGREFTEQELQEFELDNLIDAGAYIQVRHNNGYANLDGCMRLPKAEPAPDGPKGYIRVKDRPRDNGTGPATRAPGDDDDLPF